MPRTRPPYLQREVTRHGRTNWYVRVNNGPRLRIRSAYGSPEFAAEYQAALSGNLKPVSASVEQTLGWLIARYRESSAWLTLSLATRRQRENILRQVISTAGGEPIAEITRKVIVEGRERRASTPFQARHFVATMRALFAWAVEAEHTSLDPTSGVKITKPKTSGFEPWTDEEIARFESHWPRGTRERVMFDIFLYTGLRRGDAALLGRQHVKKNIISIQTEKTGTRVTIPILPELATTLRAGPIGDLTYIVSAAGRPLQKEVIGNLFRVACQRAGIKKSAHGLRKNAATQAANNGATVAELEAIFGWEGGRMAAHYTKSADRDALALRAMKKLSRTK